MHVFFLIIVIFSYWFYNSVFGFFLFSQAIDEEASCRQVFFPFVVMHVCFGTICLYLQCFNFVCCYACFLLNNSYFLLLIFTTLFFVPFYFPGLSWRSIHQATFFPFVVMHVCFITICFYLQGFNFFFVMHVFILIIVIFSYWFFNFVFAPFLQIS